MRTVNLDEKPYYELIDGELVCKYGEDSMSAQRRHQSLSRRMRDRLAEWVDERGEVETDWRFIMPSDEKRESYLPDVSVLFYESAADLDDEEYEKPKLAPDVAVEVRSPDDKPKRLAHKIATMLANGSRVVLDVDAKQRVIVAHAPDGVRTYREGEIFEHPTLPGFTFDVAAYFQSADLKRPKSGS
jgi:Uma2 family endonuclease